MTDDEIIFPAYSTDIVVRSQGSTVPKLLVSTTG